MTERPSVKIIVATHKKYRMPKWKCYLPLHVGAEGKTDENGRPLDLGYQKDNEGDNISVKNPSFCELTGLYWAWKNLKEDYIGLVHYRRYFSMSKRSRDPFENILTDRQVHVLIRRYPVIVPTRRNYVIETLYSHYAHTHYKEHLDRTRMILQKNQPDYVCDFDKAVNRKWGFMFNMMIMRRDLLDEYCSWLFPILFQLEKSVETKNLSPYQGRFYGRVSEILLNVWLAHKVRTGRLEKREIHEIPCIYMEPIHWGKKILSFLEAKFLHKKYSSSF